MRRKTEKIRRNGFPTTWWPFYWLLIEFENVLLATKMEKISISLSAALFPFHKISYRLSKTRKKKGTKLVIEMKSGPFSNSNQTQTFLPLRYAFSTLINNFETRLLDGSKEGN